MKYLICIIFILALGCSTQQTNLASTPPQPASTTSVATLPPEVTTTVNEVPPTTEPPPTEPTTTTESPKQMILPPTTTISSSTVPPTTAPPITQPSSFLSCVKNRESRGDYQALNTSSGASGAYQFLDSTWSNMGFADRYGVAKAMYASPAQQEEAAQETLSRVGRSPWSGPGC